MRKLYLRFGIELELELEYVLINYINVFIAKLLSLVFGNFWGLEKYCN